MAKEVEKKGIRIKYFGHYGISIAETSPKPIYCTILRNPVDRSISLYNHFLRDKKSAYHNLALKGFSTIKVFFVTCKRLLCLMLPVNQPLTMFDTD